MSYFLPSLLLSLTQSHPGQGGGGGWNVAPGGNEIAPVDDFWHIRASYMATHMAPYICSGMSKIVSPSPEFPLNTSWRFFMADAFRVTKPLYWRTCRISLAPDCQLITNLLSDFTPTGDKHILILSVAMLNVGSPHKNTWITSPCFLKRCLAQPKCCEFPC